jgi:excisionase family DNA binding protein
MADSCKQLQDVGPTAELLNISVRGVYRLVAEGKIPFHRVGRQLRFDPEEVLAATRVPADGRSA